MDSEKCLEELGGTNKWILQWFFLISYMKSMPCAFSMYSFQFTATKPKSFHCSFPQNDSIDAWIPKELVNGVWKYSSCMQYKNNSNGTIVPCENGYNYTMKYFTSSIITEWDLVCDRDFLNALATSSFFVMSFVGAIISCNIADRYGRKVVLLTCFTCLNLCAFVQGFVGNIYLLIFFKLWAGIFQQGCYISGFTMTIELFSLKNRSRACLVDTFSWTFSCFILIIYIYFIRDWRGYFIWTSATMLPFIGLYYFMPESIRWLLTNNRVKQAKRLLQNAAKYSKPPLPKERFDELSKEDSLLSPDLPIYNITHICKELLLLRYQLTNTFIWFTTAMTYYGLQIKVVEIGNPFINFFLTAVVEIPANVFSFPIADRFGRKLSIGITNFMVCFCLLFGYISLKVFNSSWPAIIVFLIGKMLNSGIFNLIFMHVSEIFPTTLRTTAVGMSSSSARIGASVGAMFFQMSFARDWIPFLLVFTCCLISGIIVFCLPETYRKKMPNSIEEVKEWVSEKPIISLR